MDVELVKVNYVIVLCFMVNLFYDKVFFFFKNGVDIIIINV